MTVRLNDGFRRFRGRVFGAATYLGTLFLVWGCTSDPQVPTEPQPALVPEVPLVALTPTEYNNTVRDLLGMPSDVGLWPDRPAIADALLPTDGEKNGIFGSEPLATPPWPWIFPAEAGVDHFEGMVDGQVPSPYSVEELQKAATHFASFTLVSKIFFTCSAWSTLSEDEQESCAWSSVERFAQRAWRRPITSEERTRLQEFWRSNWEGGSPEEAVVLTVAGVLLTPAFLFRVEFGGAEEAQGAAVPVTDWEMASRLSYFLWDSLPDPELFDAAYKGQLSTPKQLEIQARRMLAKGKARDAVVHFHDQWLGTHRVHGISPARRVYGPLYGLEPEPALDTTGDGEWPEILLPIRHSMEAETKLFIEQVLFDGAGTLEALLTDNHGYRSEHTASLYSEDSQDTGGDPVTWTYGGVYFSIGSNSSLTLTPTEFPADRRAGVLTLPSVLALGSYTVHPAPIHRGKLILERLACQELGTPPPGAEAEVPPDTNEAEGTNRERTEEATSPAVCVGCHETINPPGFAFENYDAMGRWRDEDNGFPIDASGSFTLWGGETLTYENAIGLAQQLAQSDRVRDCYSLRWVRYATGVHLAEDSEGLPEIQHKFRENDNIQDLLVSIVKSDLFRYRNAGETP